MRMVLIAFNYDLKTYQTAYLERISSVYWVNIWKMKNLNNRTFLYHKLASWSYPKRRHVRALIEIKGGDVFFALLEKSGGFGG